MSRLYHKDSSTKDLIHASKNERSFKCVWTTYLHNLHYLYAHKWHRFQGRIRENFQLQRHSNKRQHLQWLKTVVKYDQTNVWVHKWGFIYAAEGICDGLQLNYFSWVIALCFIYAFVHLINISRTLLDDFIWWVIESIIRWVILHTSKRSGSTDGELRNAVSVANTVHFKNQKSQCRWWFLGKCYYMTELAGHPLRVAQPCKCNIVHHLVFTFAVAC